MFKKMKLVIFFVTMALFFSACTSSTLPDLPNYDTTIPAATEGTPTGNPPPAGGTREVYHIPASSVSWGELTSFSMGWGDFHGGHQSFRIEKIDGQFFFNADACRERLMQFFVPENHPVSSYEAEAILAILKEHNADRFDGYSSGWCGDCTGDFSLSLRVIMDSGCTINTHIGCYRPVGFSELFSPLRAFLHDMAERHKVEPILVEPEWGNLQSMVLRLGTHIGAYTYRISLEDDEVYFVRDRRINNFEASRAIFHPRVMDELHQLMLEYGIDQWWGGQFEPTPNQTFSATMTMYVYYDNDTYFRASGLFGFYSNPYPTNNEAINALINFFEDLDWQRHEAARNPIITLTATAEALELAYGFVLTHEIEIMRRETKNIETCSGLMEIFARAVTDAYISIRLIAEDIKLILDGVDGASLRSNRFPAQDIRYGEPYVFHQETDRGLVRWTFVFTREQGTVRVR